MLRSGSASDVGRVRTVNEDLAFEAGSLYGVADGMGGHVGGDIAARIAVETLEETFSRNPSVEGMLAAVQAANVAVWERGRVDPDLRGMGTTLTAAALIADAAAVGGDRLILVNVGDSRAYRLREGVLEQLTTDHSVAEELVARGELTPEEANLHPHRHILTRVLGVTPEVEVDAWELFPKAGDRYLICSDGLSNEVSADQITSILARETSPILVAEDLIHTANNKGGHDNITVVVLEVVESTSGEGVVPDAGAIGEHSDDEQPAPVPLTPSAMHTPGPRRGVGTLALERPRTVGTDFADLDGSLAVEGSGTGGYGVDASTGTATKAGRKPRLITFRLVVFFLAVVVVLGGAWGLVRWYLDESYFVSVEGKQIVIDQGRPGGFLWFQPDVVDHTGVTTSEVPQNQLSGVQSGTFTASSAAAARALVRRMVLTECDYDQGVPGVTPTTTPSPKTPSIARCPTPPAAKVSTPPTTTTTTTTTTLPTGSSTTTSPSSTTTTTGTG
ncbi:MAG: Stp1/IreP family PP2C-type Ser/Thr phosphatase [Acidimicrobiales bacterium]